MHYGSLCTFIILSLFASSSVADLADTVAKVKPSIVGIGIHTPSARQRNSLNGSGFVIGNGQQVVEAKTVGDDIRHWKGKIFGPVSKTNEIKGEKDKTSDQKEAKSF